ncbi:ctl transporter, putative [Perkinsus marinus ATCC 50983]|uniref:Choline transporter-like protein n=1 Tax=Perkinsus marinus (strain ATCC 50983 / TXsc) TaxID=423536 RepID=C5KV55_PERM5|nr:ctl transporter, putative [Perkinsus marinus ATCC 50983]EER11601.1 ctl transporter, putative [Perkinsus marinus ATCC 50983]|eukprot:XP_002779806.1 ctl transporter, putative [Perkinsus marinus ATCC 50983]
MPCRYINKCVGASILDTAKDLSSGTEALQADDVQRDVIKYASYCALGLAALYLLLLLCLCKRIRLGIALNKVAAQFVYNNKLVMIIPVLQTLKCMGWWAVWLIAVCFTVSNVPDAKIKTGVHAQFTKYFTPNDAKGSLGTKPLRTGIKNAVIYHQGTLSFGSFVLAIVQFIKWWLRYLAKQAKLQHNKVMTILFKILSYCVACFEKCIKFLNKNAYIQTALLGTKFCTSAKNAFFLILRNAARIGVLGAIGNAVRLFGYLFIMGKLGATAAAGYFITLEMYDGEINSPVVPIIIYVVVGYVVGKLITNVFGLAVDSMLQCFVADEELNKASGGAQCTPPLLKKFLDKNSKR